MSVLNASSDNGVVVEREHSLPIVEVLCSAPIQPPSGKAHVRYTRHPGCCPSAENPRRVSNISGGLVGLRSNHPHGNWPSKTDLWCLHDGHPFDTEPVPIPTKKNEKTGMYEIYNAVFCSPNCAKGYMTENSCLNTPLHLMLLTLLCREWFGVEDIIECAPPRVFIDKFGGELSIEKFRKHHIQCVSRVLIPPFVTCSMVYESQYREGNMSEDMSMLSVHLEGSSTSASPHSGGEHGPALYADYLQRKQVEQTTKILGPPKKKKATKKVETIVPGTLEAFVKKKKPTSKPSTSVDPPARGLTPPIQFGSHEARPCSPVQLQPPHKSKADAIDTTTNLTCPAPAVSFDLGHLSGHSAPVGTRGPSKRPSSPSMEEEMRASSPTSHNNVHKQVALPSLNDLFGSRAPSGLVDKQPRPAFNLENLLGKSHAMSAPLPVPKVSKPQYFSSSQLEELAKDKQNQVFTYTHDTPVRNWPSDECKDAVHQVRDLFVDERIKHPEKSDKDIADSICKNPYLADFKTTHPKIFEACVSRTTNETKMRHIFVMLYHKKMEECGELSTSDAWSKTSQYLLSQPELKSAPPAGGIPKTSTSSSEPIAPVVNSQGFEAVNVKPKNKSSN